MIEAEAFLGVEKSITGKAWRSRLTSEGERIALGISQQLDLPEIVGRVLAGRGADLESASHFLNPILKNYLPDPSVFADMDVAAERMANAVTGGEKIAIFGDYDVDGATSSALLYHFLAAVGVAPGIYIPDRIKEGYGPTTPALLKLREEGIRLLVTVDCGTMAFEPLARASEAGLDVIVIDHHQAEPTLPVAVAVVNPNRLDDTSGLGQVAAVGMAFMFAIAINRILRQRGWYNASRPEPKLLNWLDLVALGTVCDVVPLTGINRALVAQGLKVMAQRKNIGLSALADVAQLAEAPGTYHAGFLLGPRINAGGRVGRSSLGADLLTMQDATLAQGLARELDQYNQDRKIIEQEVQDAAAAQVIGQFGTGEVTDPCIFVADEGWHPGVIGIVAGRLKEKYGRPAFVIGLADGIGKGSARSIPGVDLGAAVTAARQAGILINGGGHSMAAGLTVSGERLDDLKTFLCEKLTGQVAMARASSSLKLDGALTAGAATIELLEKLNLAGPFGQGNPQPRFAFANMSVAYADVVGENHVKCTFLGADGKRLKGIAFRSLEEPLGAALLSSKGRKLHVAGSLRVNSWMGSSNAELFIDDVAICDQASERL